MYVLLDSYFFSFVIILINNCVYLNVIQKKNNRKNSYFIHVQTFVFSNSKCLEGRSIKRQLHIEYSAWFDIPISFGLTIQFSFFHSYISGLKMLDPMFDPFSKVPSTFVEFLMSTKNLKVLDSSKLINIPPIEMFNGATGGLFTVEEVNETIFGLYYQAPKAAFFNVVFVSRVNNEWQCEFNLTAQADGIFITKLDATTLDDITERYKTDAALFQRQTIGENQKVSKRNQYLYQTLLIGDIQNQNSFFFRNIVLSNFN